jgi:CRP-like cAMP-binding protein
MSLEIEGGEDPRRGGRSFRQHSAIRPTALPDRTEHGFAALAPENAHRTVRVLKAETVIYHQGDPRLRICDLVSGWVVLTQHDADGRRGVPRFLLPGAIFGAEPGSNHTHSATTLTPATIGFIDKSRHDRLLRENPQLNERFIWLMERDNHLAFEALNSMANRSALARLANLLWRLTIRSLGRRPAPGEGISIPLSQIDLAAATGLSSVHVSRVLRQLRERNLLTFVGHSLVVRDPRALEALSGASETLVALWSKGAGPVGGRN